VGKEKNQGQSDFLGQNFWQTIKEIQAMDSPENKFFCGQLEACSSCPQGEVELNNSAK
jgi:hypothetical protein